jgi:hypothetical protein
MCVDVCCVEIWFGEKQGEMAVALLWRCATFIAFVGTKREKWRTHVTGITTFSHLCTFFTPSRCLRDPYISTLDSEYPGCWRPQRHTHQHKLYILYISTAVLSIRPTFIFCLYDHTAVGTPHIKCLFFLPVFTQPFYTLCQSPTTEIRQ